MATVAAGMRRDRGWCSRAILYPLSSLLVFASLTGCGKVTPEQGVVPQPNPQPDVAVDVDQRIKEARRLTNEVAEIAGRLPAPSDQHQRQLMRDAFDRLSRVLPMLMGPEADGQFRLQQRIVADARDQLDRAGERLAVEPTVDSGLRAAYNALVRVAQESFYTSDRVTEAITALRDRVDALDTVRGPMHRMAAGEALRQTATVMDQMVRIYDRRLDVRGSDTEAAKPSPKRPSEEPPSAQPQQQQDTKSP